MPTYVFECLQCGSQREEVMSFKDLESKKFKCHGKMKRIITSAAFHLMGNCWARDGYTRKPDRFVEEQIRQNRIAEGATKSETEL